MHICTGSAAVTAFLFLSNVFLVQGDPGDSANPIIPSCEDSGINGELLKLCQEKCFFLPEEAIKGFPPLAGSMICDVPKGSHMVNYRRYFEACRLSCVQPGVEIGGNTRLYIGQSEIADSERQMDLQEIENVSQMDSVVAYKPKRYGWPYCTSAADCIDVTLRTLGFVARCVVYWGGTALAVCSASNNIRLDDGRPLGNAVTTAVITYVTQKLSGIRAKLPWYLGGRRGRAQRLAGAGGGTSRLVNGGGLGGRSVLSDEEIQEQEDEAQMWAERICVCNATYTSNGCCFSMDGIVLEDPSLNQGPLVTDL